MKKCRLCKETQVHLLIDFGKQPIVHQLLNNKDDDYDEYPFELGLCSKCSLVQQISPISPLILYENYFTVSSWKNQPHVDRLLEVMKSITGLNNKTRILEIGCNDGGFIERLQKYGIKECIGIEPSKDAYNLAKSKGINVHNEFFSIKNPNLDFEENFHDIVICRQVLEHISDLEEFMLSVDYCLKDQGIFVIEIPDSRWNFEYMDYALWEEHVNYFTLNSLNNLLKKYGFRIIHYETTLFSGRALTVFAEKRATITNSFEYNSDDLVKCHLYGKNWEIFKKQMYELVSSKEKVVVYGCGARSSTFVNFIQLENVICYIDDQKEKQSYFVPGSRLEILPWDDSWSNGYFLLGVNTENEMKVIRNKALNEQQFLSILPPSRFLPDFWKDMLNV